MTEQKRSPVAGAKRLLLPAIALLAFAAGALVFGNRNSSPAAEHSHGASAAKAQIWTCSMHPQIRADGPGACPICGMDLIPVAETGAAELARDEVALSESAKIRAKIQTSLVKRLRDEGVERRLLGRVDYDETGLHTVTSWIDGRIDRLHVQTTGQTVKRGQVIATLYSPEVFSAHQDLLVAQEQLQRLAGASEIARSGAQAALAAARGRLRLLGITGPALQAMEQAKKPSEQVKIRSTFAGTIIERLATEGSYVKAGTGLFQIADLSKLWVQLDAYESDLSLLSTGQLVDLRVEALPGTELQGRVTFVDPVINQRTRTARVRIEVSNGEGRLRPGMFAEAIVRSDDQAPKESALVIPESAPLFTGRRSLVYVELPNTSMPTYQARVVKLGSRTGLVYPVLAGLSEGERIVTHGAFTLDADLQIRGGSSMMSIADDHEVGPFDSIVTFPEEHKGALAALVLDYLALHEALAADDLKAASAAGARIATATDLLQPTGSEELRAAWAPLSRELMTHGHELAAASNIEAARASFRSLSQQMATILRIFGNPTKETIRLAHCPMALEGQGAEWLQRSTKIENPYFGASMHTCGDIHESVEHNTFLPMLSGAGATPAGSSDTEPTP